MESNIPGLDDSGVLTVSATSLPDTITESPSKDPAINDFLGQLDTQTTPVGRPVAGIY